VFEATAYWPPPDGDISFDCMVDEADAVLTNRIVLGRLSPNATLTCGGYTTLS
jgi:hypothetical protein